VDYMKTGKTLADVKNLLEKNKLKCIGGFYCGIEAFSSPESQKKNHDTIYEMAKLVHDLGGTNLVIGTDGPEDLSKAPDPVGQMAKAVGEVARRVEPLGVNLLIEFNWSPFVKSLRTAVDIARRSGAANAGVLFDPAHFHCTPSKLEQITPDAVKYIKHVHVDDMRDKPGELSNCNADRELPGKGCLDLKTIFGQIEKGGYKGMFSIEMFSDELWNMPAKRAAKLMYDSLIPLTSGK